jgi:uncharacterized cupredoxin-like copper-binding protein
MVGDLPPSEKGLTLRQNPLRMTAIAVALTLALGLSACSSDDSSSESSDSGGATTTTQAPANAQSIDTSLTEMAISVSPDSATAGDVTFNVTNDGTMPHELVVIKTDKKAGDLPTDSSGTADETGSIGETEVEPGASSELSLNLKAGHYALICNLPGHYSAGMYADFNVK